MPKRNLFTRMLAIVGTALVWFPLLIPVVMSAERLVRGGRLMFDYLLPAELFPVALAGALLLLWAALRARSRQKLIGWGLGIAVVAPVVGAVLAMATGLASGQNEPAGWRLALVGGMFIVYCLALVVIGVGGVLLLRDLLAKGES